MTIPVGAPGWYEAWSPEQRRATLSLAQSKLRWLVFWLGAALVGVVLAVGSATTGNQVMPDPSLLAPPAPMVIALVSLAFDIVALLLNWSGWRRVRAVFAGSASAATLQGMRARTAVPILLAQLVGMFAMVWVAMYPWVTFTEEGIEAIAPVTVATAAVVAVLLLACGLAPSWLRVKLYRVRLTA
ncbi:hypothetical protein OHB12_19450 [Nocardia sp. NBC_01730]|uniref:hypothetical protein n=1 Tax=Nocardia sp. NBC_01730 TaxID=2975998 RepID=UPI002E101869|nr:hypothetical protein OHB12_19450 [Nocardia sp. NBC_01730]